MPLVHAGNLRDAAQLVSDTCSLNLRIDSDDPALTQPPLAHWLHFLLNTPGGMFPAAQLLWTPNQFDPRPRYTQDLWKFFDETNFGLIMGGASTSKSFSMGVRIFLEWVRDPAYTTVNLVGPNEQHLEKNLFSHLVGLHQTASLPLPGKIFKLWIGLDRHNQLGAIHGVVIPIGQTRKAGKLQGGKRVRRIHPHPIFGGLSRMLVLVDEIENVPEGLWGDIDNISSLADTKTVNAGFKLFGSYNPRDRTDEVAKRAEPKKGWAAFDIDADFRWSTRRGWDVIRLDGEKSENVAQSREIFFGLQTKEGLEQIARNAGGKHAAGYYSMGRGAYPVQGMALTIFPPGLVDRMRGEFIWYEAPKVIAGGDLALEGGDGCLVALGEFGLATGVKYPPSLLHPNGHKVMFKTESGAVTPRHGAMLKNLFTIEKGDTLDTAERLIEFFKKAGVRPNLVSLDGTGWGAGTANILKRLWSSEINVVSYTEGSTEVKLFTEDVKTCAESYERIYSELWFAMRGWAEFGYLLIHSQVEGAKLFAQLGERLSVVGVRSKVESKKDYKNRGFASPNEADALSLMVHAARKTGVQLSMRGESSEAEGASEDSWFTDGVIIDATNRFDSLEIL